jgi:hypothetical protein
VDAGTARGMGGGVCTVWGVTDVVGIMRGTAEVGEAGDEGVTHGLAV